MKEEFYLITRTEWARMAELANASSILTPDDGKMWKNVKHRGDPFKILKECIDIEIKGIEQRIETYSDPICRDVMEGYAGVFRYPLNLIEEHFQSVEGMNKLKLKMKEAELMLKEEVKK